MRGLGESALAAPPCPHCLFAPPPSVCLWTTECDTVERNSCKESDPDDSVPPGERGEVEDQRG